MKLQIIRFDECVKLAKAQYKQYKVSFTLDDDHAVELFPENYLLSINWAVYKFILQIANLYKHFAKYNILWVLSDYDRAKSFSTSMLKLGPKYDRYFYLFVGIENLFGFNYAGLNTRTDIPTREWVQNKFKPVINGSNELYMESYEEEMRAVFDWRTDTVQIPHTAEEFCLQIPLTSTAGSAFDPGGKRTTLIVDGEEYKLEGNKFNKSAALTLEEKMYRLKTKLRQQAKVNVKLEPFPKFRLIISSDYNMYLKMKMLGTWLDLYFKGYKQGSIWQTIEQQLQQWLDCATVGLWAFPIDQSKWDHHISFAMIMSVFTNCKRKISQLKDNQARADMLEVIDSIIYGLENCIVLAVDDKGITVKIIYEAGVLSGWYLTAFLNSIINIVEVRVANKECKALYKGYRGQEYLYVMGDDQAEAYKYLTDGLLFWLTLVNSGYEIHPSKNFISNVHNEYLRKYMTKDGINSYPARLINKITAVYVGSRDSYKPLEYCANICSRWTMMAQRLRKPINDIILLLKSDLRKAKIDKRVRAIYPSMRAENGGPELIKPFNNYKIQNIPGTFVKQLIIKGAGLVEFKKTFGYGQERALDNWALKSLNVGQMIKSIELKTDDELAIQEEEVKKIEFMITEDESIVEKPEILKGWIEQDIISPNSKVMQRAFPGIDKYMDSLKNNVPHSWYYDFVTNRLTVPLPTKDNYSKAALALYSTRYVNSLYRAMINKRKAENKWVRLGTYFKDNIWEKISMDNKMLAMMVV